MSPNVSDPCRRLRNGRRGEGTLSNSWSGTQDHRQKISRRTGTAKTFSSMSRGCLTSKDRIEAEKPTSRKQGTSHCDGNFPAMALQCSLVKVQINSLMLNPP